jgi:hypothetical protein
VKKIIHSDLTAFLIIGFAVFAIWFRGLNNFGMHEDDYAFIGNKIGLSHAEIISYIKNFFKAFPQGRPLAESFIAWVVFEGARLTGDLSFAYGTGAFIIFINALLLYFLLKRWLRPISSLAGALFYILIPVDTTKIFLTHALHLQPALLLSLLATHFYLRYGKVKKLIAYFLAFCSLLFYETAILFFAFAPFFEGKPGLSKRMMRHILILLLIIIAIPFAGLLRGETRMQELSSGSPAFFIFKFVSEPFIGAAASLAAICYGIGLGVLHFFDQGIIEIILLLFFSIAVIFIFFQEDQSPANGLEIQYSLPQILSRRKAWTSPASFMMLTGLIMIPASYLFSFTHYPPISISGRGNSVNLASSLAWPVFLAGLTSIIFSDKNVEANSGNAQLSLWKRNKGYQNFSRILILFILLSWSSYASWIKKGYKSSWKEQKKFWIRVGKIAPDINAASVVIFDNTVREDGSDGRSDWKKIILGAEWSMPYAFHQYYNSTADDAYPIAYRSRDSLAWKKEGGHLFFFENGPPAWGEWHELDTVNTIFISMNKEGELIRPHEMEIKTYPANIKLIQSQGSKWPELKEENSIPLMIRFKAPSDEKDIYGPHGPLYNFMMHGEFTD